MACLRTLFALALLFAGGCVGFTFERSKDGVPEPVEDAKALVPGETTLADALAALGPPDLVLRTWNRDRCYWVCWDSDYFKFRVALWYPGVEQAASRDLFILTDGDESLRFARLDFDEEGVLRETAHVETPLDRSGEYGMIEDAIVSNYLEDRERALGVRQQPSDEKSDEKKGKNRDDGDGRGESGKNGSASVLPDSVRSRSGARRPRRG
ncbi:MAG: hypothetical protein ABFS86_07950 [Planctomycetota bacterium]